MPAITLSTQPITAVGRFDDIGLHASRCSIRDTTFPCSLCAAHVGPNNYAQHACWTFAFVVIYLTLFAYTFCDTFIANYWKYWIIIDHWQYKQTDNIPLRQKSQTPTRHTAWWPSISISSVSRLPYPYSSPPCLSPHSFSSSPLHSFPLRYSSLDSASVSGVWANLPGKYIGLPSP